jgi:lysophospholipid acyltransferase (LPLAT)-like uncharacterized protein
MTSGKRTARSETLRRCVSALAAFHIWLVYFTCRWQVIGGDIPRRFWDSGKPFILCFWHGRILMIPYCWDRSVPVHMLISQHRDGRIIAGAVKGFGINAIAGSSSRGGGAALRAMLRKLRSGQCVGITPDGPRGPLMRASVGVVNLARLAGVPIVPVAYSASRRRVLSSWDRFVLALPLGRVAFVWGEPVTVPADADGAALEAARKQVEDRLNAITRKADGLCGHAAIEPAGGPEGAATPAASEAAGGVAAEGPLETGGAGRC